MPVLVSLHHIKGNPGSGIREIIACGTRKLGNVSLWNPESLAAWNPQYHSRNPESHKLSPSAIQFPLTRTGIQFLESRIYGVESRIQDCLGFPLHWTKVSFRGKEKTSATSRLVSYPSSPKKDRNSVPGIQNPRLSWIPLHWTKVSFKGQIEPEPLPGWSL